VESHQINITSLLSLQDTPPPNSYDIVAFDKSFGHASLAEPRTKGAKRFQGGFLSGEPRVSSFLQSDPNLPGMSFETKIVLTVFSPCISSDAQ
jgi:hypothetical protein